MAPLSLTDQNTLDQLRVGRDALLKNGGERSALRVLRRKLQTVTRNVYILWYLVDEGEVFCDILVDGVTVVHMEIPPANAGADIVFESMTVAGYRRWKRRLSRIDLRRLELARELAHTEGNSP
jgi:hypothetical protein